MRTTLVIDDDLLAVAKSLARDRSQSVGEVISELARRGLDATPRVGTSSTGFPVFNVRKGARPITSDDVKKIEDDF